MKIYINCYPYLYIVFIWPVLKPYPSRKVNIPSLQTFLHCGRVSISCLLTGLHPKRVFMLSSSTTFFLYAH